MLNVSGMCLPKEAKTGGIRKSPVVVADMRSFGREVKLLEKLWRYGYTRGSPVYISLLLVLHEPIPIVHRRHVELPRL